MGLKEPTEKPDETKPAGEPQPTEGAVQETQKPEQTQPSDASGLTAPLAESVPPTAGPKTFVFGAGRVVITLSNEAFAATVIVALLLIIAAFALGNFWGGRKASKAERLAAGQAQTTSAPRSSIKVRDTGIVRKEVAAPVVVGKPRETRTTSALAPASPVAARPGPPEPTASYWTIQVIAGINANKAEELRTLLTQQGFPDVVVTREGRYASVRVGRFESKDSPEAQKFKKLISEMKYENKLQFSGCYLVKVQ